MRLRQSNMVIGLGAVFLLAPLILQAPQGVSEEGWRALGLLLAMALLWLSGALPLAVTALLPLAIAPLLGISPMATVAAYYSHPLIILFLGGFLLAKAIERWGLHRRLALTLLGYAGQSPGRILAAMMATTAFLSLWVNNTSSAMVLAPVAGAIAASQPEHPKFGAALMLGVAFAATIGGMGSLIGTPPNAVFAAHMSATYGIEIGFAQWAMVGLPTSLILLTVTWVVLARVSPGTPTAELTMSFDQDIGAMTSAERRVATVAVLTAMAWITRPLLEMVVPWVSLTDAGIAMVAAVSLFLIPAGDRDKLLDWDTAKTLRWDVLILIGGGLALAGLVERTGLAAWLGGQTPALHYLPTLALIFLVAALIVYVGELASNTAMAALFLPIASASAVALEIDPVTFILPVALAASVGFMLPVATPPNAIVFSYPSVTRTNMLRAGALLDVAGIVVAVAMGVLLGPLVFGEVSPP
ncbi:DASS family sodium-coupled anion symporter [Roseobacter sp. YSTF-M11]|uniref:DASS family sodium-coupled anion symporter n=1 Tax=Roseobacter insulae TaxID=2859783 RepID=A0A9X1K1S0_9RHOB|nr:DASS family sodium-coupled anion symporter [Roseobacter insulae]MBW4706812.1 DASS family sodium-coupled anion symporter [Roseobacter insulae]